MSRCLIDTNALLWTFYAPSRLTKKAAAAILAADEIYYSILSPWEIGLKFSRGGYHDLKIPTDWEKTLIGVLEHEGYKLVQVEISHCRLIQDLPFHHKDPFDRMLIAQALVGNLTVIGSDEMFDAYGVTRVW